MRLSVLSALARMNVDPWEEATRLAAMPKVIAERTLVSTLDLVTGRGWNQSEAEVIAARLIRLLPQRRDGETIAATQIEIENARAQRTRYWLVWLGFAIAMSILSPRHQATTTDAGTSTSKSNTTSPLKSSSANSALPSASDQSH